MAVWRTVVSITVPQFVEAETLEEAQKQGKRIGEYLLAEGGGAPKASVRTTEVELWGAKFPFGEPKAVEVPADWKPPCGSGAK